MFELGTLYFLSRALSSDQRRWGSWIAAAVIGSVGFYTYIAYRIFPVIVVAFLAEKLIRNKLFRNVKPLVVAAILAIVVIAPLAKFFADHTQSLSDRMKRTQVWNQKGRGEAGPVMLVAQSAAKTIGMFTYKGDSIARHNVREEPMLSPFSTAFFVLGGLLVLVNAGRPYAIFLLVYFLFTLLPGILSVGAPNVPRNFGSVPVAMLFTSFGIFGALKIILPYAHAAGTLLLAIVLSGNLLTGTIDSMVRQPAILDSLSPKLAALWGMDRDQANVARLINQLGDGCEVYLSPQFFFHSTIEYLTYSKSTHRLITPFMDLRKDASRDKVIVVVFQPHEINPWWLRDDDGKSFYKWWRQVHGMETSWIRTTVRRSYDPPLTKTSDWKLVKKIRDAYPNARELRFENFHVFVFSLRN
jgi:hypothetical protein